MYWQIIYLINMFKEDLNWITKNGWYVTKPNQVKEYPYMDFIRRFLLLIIFLSIRLLTL